MARRKPEPTFDSVWAAVVAESPDAVSQLLADGAEADEREDRDAPTPLMYAAAVGNLRVVEQLVAAGADVNAATEHDAVELPDAALPDDQPDDSFLDGPASASNWQGWTASVYAATFGRQDVFDFLLPRASPAVRQSATAVAAARKAHARPAARPAKTSRGGSAAARAALLAEHPKAARWVVRCALCGREGHKPEMPADFDRHGTAARVRELFRPLVLEDSVCRPCLDKADRAGKAAEKVVQRRLAELPPHVKIEVVQPKRGHRRPRR
jgi:hypothetical protein